jgi:hypothetical protein
MVIVRTFETGYKSGYVLWTYCENYMLGTQDVVGWCC